MVGAAKGGGDLPLGPESGRVPHPAWPGILSGPHAFAESVPCLPTQWSRHVSHVDSPYNGRTSSGRVAGRSDLETIHQQR